MGNLNIEGIEGLGNPIIKRGVVLFTPRMEASFDICG
jgi:hypothetical protein